MFDDLIRELDSLKEFKYEMKIMSDEEGYVDKECPREECLKKFKIYAEDFSIIKEEENMYCPFCGGTSNRENWYTTEQINQAKAQAQEYAMYRFNKAMSEGIRKANRRLNHSKGFIKFKLDFKSSTGNNFINLPARALEEMQQKIECPECGCKYEVIGISYFCPKCGINSLDQTLDKSLDKIKTNIKNIPLILQSSLNKDDASMICETIKETSLNNIVTAFQVYCESKYDLLKTGKKLQRNLFQSLGKGSFEFNEAIGIEYSDIITEEELNKLVVCFQKRHCFEHNNGIVDDEYIKKSKDTKYNIGERIIIDNREILKYVDIIKKLCLGLKENIEKYLKTKN